MKTFSRIAFFGDSVTEGCFELYPTSYGFDTARRPEDGYVEKTMKKLHEKYGFLPEYHNFAKAGASTHGGLSQVEEAASYAPDLAIACFGLNNAMQAEEHFYRALKELFTELKKLTETIIYLTPNRMNTYLHPQLTDYTKKVATATMMAQNDGKFDRMMVEAKKIAASFGVAVCDIYAVWCDMAETTDITAKCLSNFINHPTPKMHDLTADLLTQKILSL